jgi:hypothetical protein
VTTATPPLPLHYRSKTVAAWLALLLGTLGVHRMYLFGLRDFKAWLHPLPTALGLLGVQRIRSLGQDDQLAWLLIPFLGLMLSMAMLQAIVYALTPDDVWHQRYNADRPAYSTGWGPVIAAVLALLLGGTTLVGTIAYGGQKFFEWQMQDAAESGVQKISRLSP